MPGTATECKSTIKIAVATTKPNVHQVAQPTVKCLPDCSFRAPLQNQFTSAEDLPAQQAQWVTGEGL